MHQLQSDMHREHRVSDFADNTPCATPSLNVAQGASMASKALCIKDRCLLEAADCSIFFQIVI